MVECSAEDRAIQIRFLETPPTERRSMEGPLAVNQQIWVRFPSFGLKYDRKLYIVPKHYIWSMKHKNRTTKSMVINIRTVMKNTTDMRVSEEVMYELKNFLEDCIAPKIMGLAEKCAKAEKKSTIQERDYLKARDYFNVALTSLE